MKVYLGKYVNWVGPYQIADKIFFWVEKYPSKELEQRWDFKLHDRFGTWLASTWVNTVCKWIDSKKKRKIKIHIDYYDVWSMDHTLAPIILPMLKQLKATKHGSGYIDFEDVPEHMRTTEYEDYDEQKCFEFYHEDVEKRKYDVHDRFEWALDEMIFAFEHLVDDSWEEKYSSGVWDTYSEACKFDEEGNPTLYEMKYGPNHTRETDWDGLKAEWDRVDNGLRLFGKYFRTLWD